MGAVLVTAAWSWLVAASPFCVGCHLPGEQNSSARGLTRMLMSGKDGLAGTKGRGLGPQSPGVTLHVMECHLLAWWELTGTPTARCHPQGIQAGAPAAFRLECSSGNYPEAGSSRVWDSLTQSCSPVLVRESSFPSKGFLLIRVAEPSHNLTWEQQDSGKSH